MHRSLLTRSRFIIISVLALAATACTQRDAGARPPGGGEITFTPRGSLRSDPDPRTGGRVPGGAAGITPIHLETGWFELTGPAVAGTASITDAVVWDPFASDMPPFGTGGVGVADVTVSGTRYEVRGADAFVAEYTDEEGTAYLVLQTSFE